MQIIAPWKLYKSGKSIILTLHQLKQIMEVQKSNANESRAPDRQLMATEAMPSHSPPNFSLQASTVQMQAESGSQQAEEFPWQGRVTGDWSIALRSSPSKDEQNPHQNTFGDLERGTPVTVLGQSGAWYRVSGLTIQGEVKEGYASKGHIVSETVFSLNETVAAIDSDMNELYANSFNADRSAVVEWGSAVVEREDQIYATNKKTDNNAGGVAINHAVARGEELIGDVHTHPYSIPEGAYEGVAFSSGDIDTLRYLISPGFQRFVEAGTKRFALVIEDVEKATEFFANNSTSDIDLAWNNAFSAGTGSFQENVIAAVRAVLGNRGDSGIGFYETGDRRKLNFSEVGS